ncbi:hypothetical protein [Streptomyces sp. MP131-18]|uniref:beta barrel domain-containing protein n=1 Tax=Streptomyces sp. MP131-18 TaxID=1857892 RepID=UPI00097BD1E9|nr:hypothetical protein [Streptomyces sp. MP131-18]ONK10349.1 hypothetical protein STBA_10710 [Streptomyces sp. MP131-18]
MAALFSKENVKVGDTLLLRDGPKLDEVTVVKVGRTLVHVRKYGRPMPFRMSDGGLNERMFGYGMWLTTPEIEAERERAAALEDRLKEFGIALRFGYSKPSTAKLEALLKVMESEDG